MFGNVPDEWSAAAHLVVTDSAASYAVWSVPPQIRYARSGSVNIAYQIAGAGTVDLLMIPGWVTHLALDWHEPRWVGWFERMTAFARIIRFDKRGTGMSDRPLGIPTADERMADALAVMDAAGVARAHVLGWSEGGPLGVMVAATYPERVQSLTLYGTQARFTRGDDYPFGEEESEDYFGELERDCFIQLPGSAHAPWLGDAERFCTEVEHFVTGVRPVEREPGAVRTILHCDIVGSTALAVSLGDERWSELLADYDTSADLAVGAHGGRVVDRTGDGFMAAFEGPVGAIRAARRLQQEAQELDLQVRAGLHIGEVREEGGLLRGIAVHVAARVMSEAQGGEILVSETVRDVVAGANLSFSDRGARELKGIEGQRRLFAVTVESDGR